MDWTLAWTFLMKVIMAILDWTNAKKEKKEAFLKWANHVNKRALDSAKLHDDWNEIREQMKADDAAPKE